ncbi:MAG: GAF domain-containing protein [Pseudomonadota bacterium]
MPESRPSPDLRDLLGEAALACAEAPTPEAAFQVIADAADQALGHRLLTVLRLDADTMEVERYFSTDPVAYPPGGTKPMRTTWWGQHVLVNGQPYIGYNGDDIREHFADHDVILGLGLASILNLPVRLQGRTLGTVNMLNVEGHYAQADVPTGIVLSALLTGPLLQVQWQAAAR